MGKKLVIFIGEFFDTIIASNYLRDEFKYKILNFNGREEFDNNTDCYRCGSYSVVTFLGFEKKNIVFDEVKRDIKFMKRCNFITIGVKKPRNEYENLVIDLLSSLNFFNAEIICENDDEMKKKNK